MAIEEQPQRKTWGIGVFVVRKDDLVGWIVRRGVDIAAHPSSRRGAEHVLQRAARQGVDHGVEVRGGLYVEAAQQNGTMLQQLQIGRAAGRGRGEISGG